MKIRATPTTTRIAPSVLSRVIFSWKNAKPANAENSGVVEEIGTAWAAAMLRKL